jgi:hypothetical protein
MTPTLTTDLATLPTGRLAAADIEADRPVDIMAALFEALSGSEHYRLSERGGELYIEPAGQPRH